MNSMNFFPACLLMVLLVTLSFFRSEAKGDDVVTEPQTEHHFQRTVETQQSIEYLLFLPKNYDAERTEGWPMMLFLHGAGERGDDLEKVKVHGPPKQVQTDSDFPFVLVSPQCPEGQAWDVAVLEGLLDQMLSEHNIDPRRVYLTGLSMGGYGTWSFATAHPARFAAIVPICGGGQRLPIILASGEKKKNLQRLPIWAFHGGKDSVVPLDETERMIDAFHRIEADEVKLTVYPEADHDSWTQTYNNPELYTWLLKHQLRVDQKPISE